MFHAYAYELHRRHRPNILIIIEPRIAEARAQGVIDLYVDLAGFSCGIWLLWNEGPSFNVEIITCSEHSIHALVKVPSSSLSFLLTTVYVPPHFIKRKLFWDYLEQLAMTLPFVDPPRRF